MTHPFKLSAAVCAGAFVALTARAEWAVGRGALQLETSLSGVYDSNLNGAANNRSDYYLNFHPVARYRQVDARFKTNVSAGVRIKRYLDATVSDSEDADARFDWNMARDADHTTGANLNLSYFENNEAVFDVNQQVRSRIFLASAGGEVLVARRNLLSASVTYHDDKHDIGSDQTSRSGRLGYSYMGFTDGTALNIGFLYQRSQSTDSDTGARVLDQTGRTLTAAVVRPLFAETVATLTYGYRWLDRGAVEENFNLRDRSGGFVSLSVNGPFLPRQYFPKTTGTFRLAYEQAEVPGMNDASNERFVGELNVTWQARERTTVSVFVRRSQDLTITDQTVVSLAGGVTLRQAVGQFISVETGVAYQEADFVGWDRTDDRYTAHASGTYAINRYWSSVLAYRYTHSRSNLGIANFSRHVVELTLTYAF